MIKTCRWEWVDKLLGTQPGRTLTLPALLAFSRSLHEEKGVRRKHLRLAGAKRGADEARRDARSKRLLPVDFVEGQEVEALFQKVQAQHPQDKAVVAALFFFPSRGAKMNESATAAATQESREKKTDSTKRVVDGSTQTLSAFSFPPQGGVSCRRSHRPRAWKTLSHETVCSIYIRVHILSTSRPCFVFAARA